MRTRRAHLVLQGTWLETRLEIRRETRLDIWWEIRLDIWRETRLVIRRNIRLDIWRETRLETRLETRTPRPAHPLRM
jgi:hypothetical protein